VAARRAHNPEVGGSIPPPVIDSCPKPRAACFGRVRAERMHAGGERLEIVMPSDSETGPAGTAGGECMPEELKRCSLCEADKPLDEFAFKRGGRSARCKSCESSAGMARVARLKGAGLCTKGCGREARESAIYCPECASKHNARSATKRRSRQARGLCRDCTRDEPATCGCLCRRHWSEKAAYDALGSRSLAPVVIEVWERAAGRCAITGLPIAPGGGASLDHVRAKSAGGLHTADNLRFVRLDVNQARGTKTDEELFAMCEAILSGPAAAEWRASRAVTAHAATLIQLSQAIVANDDALIAQEAAHEVAV
jgi:hypothetical protein